MKIYYSPSVREKLRLLRESAGRKTIGIILGAVDDLSTNPKKCPTVENFIDIPNPYRVLHVEHRYLFYRIKDEAVYIVEMYHEKENFMWKMFGVSLRTKESIDYWGE